MYTYLAYGLQSIVQEANALGVQPCYSSGALYFQLLFPERDKPEKMLYLKKKPASDKSSALLNVSFTLAALSFLFTCFSLVIFSAVSTAPQQCPQRPWYQWYRLLFLLRVLEAGRCPSHLQSFACSSFWLHPFPSQCWNNPAIFFTEVGPIALLFWILHSLFM